MTYRLKDNCLKFSFFSILLLFLQPGFAQRKFPTVDKAIMEKKAVFGEDLVVIISGKDSVLYQLTSGSFNSKTQAPIASCSKWLTAALVMQFVDEGKISLDERISKYLPVFTKYGKGYITIRQCLSHLTGIQSDPIRLLKLLERRKYASLEEEVNDFAGREIQANPGNEFRYGNIGLNIAGRLLEVVSKKKFDLLIRQKLLLPLGMRQTTFSTTDGTAVNPSGGAKSTAEDYMHFLQMLLNDGSYKGQQILSAASVNELRQQQTTKEQIKYSPKSAEGFNYALGNWVLESRAGEKAASVLASPGLFGTWPMVDWCRDYACIFFVKSFLGEQKADAYMEVKKAIDQNFISKCR